MSSLFPLIKPYKSEFLPVSPLHTLSISQYGNPTGKPILFIHGGPGGGADDADAQRFNPEAYRIILFDQRGSGKSTPASELVDNTTQALIEDIEKIRKHLQVGEKWDVFGGSWGSTLSLAYAQAHPTHVKSLTLRGIFTLRKKELDFFYQGPGTSFLFPDYWDDFIAPIPEAERGDMVAAYYSRLTGKDEKVRAEAGRAWSRWEMASSRLHVDPHYIERADEPGFADAFARIESHYFINKGFIEDGELLLKENIDKIRHIPAVIVQGRYDCVCPATTAWELHKQWPEAEFILIPDAGHSAIEEGTTRALVAATNAIYLSPYRDISSSTLIVGANRGIGFGLVEQCLIRDARTIVYATARDATQASALHKLSETYPGRFVILQLDMVDEKSIADAVVELKKHTPTLERIIVNAAVCLGQGRIEDCTSADLLAILETNVIGPHNISKALSPFLLASKAEHRVLGYISSLGGSIILAPVIASLLKDAFKIDYIPMSGYYATKAALNMLGTQWGDALEAHGIAVPLLHPGIVATDANPAGGISVTESANGLLDVLETVRVGDGAKELLGYDGTTSAW